jgi:hypothetical protein
VRSADKGTHLKETFASYGDKFELVVVPDITKACLDWIFAMPVD